MIKVLLNKLTAFADNEKIFNYFLIKYVIEKVDILNIPRKDKILIISILNKLI